MFAEQSEILMSVLWGERERKNKLQNFTTMWGTVNYSSRTNNLIK